MRRIFLPILVLLFLVLIRVEVKAQTPEFKPSVNVWGLVFGDYYVKAHADSAGRGGKNVQYSPVITSTPGSNGVAGSEGANAFQIRRAYLGFDYRITEKISTSLVLANEQNLDASGNNTTYLKLIYLKYADIFPKSNLIFGQMSTPSFSMPFGTDQLWGYRSIEKTVMDMHGIDGSNDFGVALQGNLWQKKVADDSLKPDILGYAVMVGNGGSNSSKPESDIFKKFRATVFVSMLEQKLTIGIYADYNRLQLSPVKQENTTYKAYVHYKTRKFRIGAEAFEQVNTGSDKYIDENSTAVMVNGVQQALSVFVTGKILKNMNYFARMDKYNPDTKFNNSYRKGYVSTAFGSVTANTISSATSTYNQTFVTLGLDYTITKRVHIMPNVWYNKYDSKLNNVSDKIKSDYDLVPRLTFFVIFNTSKNVSGNGMDY